MMMNKLPIYPSIHFLSHLQHLALTYRASSVWWNNSCILKQRSLQLGLCLRSSSLPAGPSLPSCLIPRNRWVRWIQCTSARRIPWDFVRIQSWKLLGYLLARTTYYSLQKFSMRTSETITATITIPSTVCNEFSERKRTSYQQTSPRKLVP